MKRILAVLALLVGVSATTAGQDNTDRQKSIPPQPFIVTEAHIGSSPFNPPTVTDANFVVDTGAGLDSGCTFRSGGPLRITLPINRVVGDVNADGTLVDPQTLISNGVVSKFATLSMPAFDVDFDASVAPDQPERDHILVNGAEIGPASSIVYLTGANDVWKLNEFQIPIELLRFGRRNVGGAPTAGQNVIEIQIDVANAGSQKELWCTAIDWVSLKFQALAPVIMVHGNNSSGKFFEDFKFVQSFKDQKIPFDNSINMTTATISAHGDLLATRIPAIAKEFGARHVHIIAHSKGGLDTRDFLARTVPSNFGVLSLITLSTPHHGSVGADYSLDAQNANSLFSDSTIRTKLAQQVTPDVGTTNLRVSFVENFNLQNGPLLPRQFTVDGETNAVQYFSFSADANLDDSKSIFGNPTIQRNEINGTPEVNNLRGPLVMEQVYRLLGEVASTQLETKTILGHTVYVVKETPTQTFQLNDFLVTVNSARFNGFTEILSTKANHATIANMDIANQAIIKIKSVQPIH
jgi:triacylglycerol lipase